MSSTKQDPNNNTRIKLGIAALVVCATCFSSIGFSSNAQAQEAVVENEESLMATTVEVAVVAGALAAYGWLADKTYDLGKEVGKYLAGSSPAPAEPVLQQDAEYLLN